MSQEDTYILNSAQNKSTYWVFISFVIIVLAQLLLWAETHFELNIQLLRYGLNLLAIFFVGKAVITNKYRTTFPSTLVKALVFAFLFWNLIVILRGIPIMLAGEQNHLHLKQFLSGQFYLYFLPIIVLIHPDMLFLRNVFKFSLTQSIIYVLATLLFFGFFIFDVRNGAEWFARLLAAASSLILITLPYHSPKARLVSVITLTLALTLMAIFARRNMVVYFSSVILISSLIVLLNQSAFVKKRKGSYFFGSFLVVVFVGLLFSVFRPDFSYLEERLLPGLKDREVLFLTRETVIDDFHADFNRQPNDWLIGRGIFGEFESTLAAAESPEGTRDLIENGFLFAILKGGYIYLVLFIVISLVSMHYGYFKSKNLLSKAFATIILIQLIDMVGYGIPVLSFKYFFVWIAIAGCLSKSLRNLSDEYLKLNVGLK